MQQYVIFVFAEPIHDRPDTPVQPKLTVEATQLGGVARAADDCPHRGACSEQATDRATDGGDLDLARGVADEHNLNTSEASHRTGIRRIERNQRGLILERLHAARGEKVV